MTVKTLITKLLEMPMDAEIDGLYENTKDHRVEPLALNTTWIEPVDYEDGTIGLIISLKN